MKSKIWLMKRYLCVSMFHSQCYCLPTQYLQGWTQHVLSLHLKGDETPADRHESLIFELASKKSNRVCSQTHTDCLWSFARWHASKDFISLFRKDTRSSFQSPLSKKKTELQSFPKLFNHIFLLMSRKYVSVVNEKYVLDQWEAFSHGGHQFPFPASIVSGGNSWCPWTTFGSKLIVVFINFSCSLVN